MSTQPKTTPTKCCEANPSIWRRGTAFYAVICRTCKREQRGSSRASAIDLWNDAQKKTTTSTTRRVKWVHGLYGVEGSEVMINLGALAHVVSRDLAEQIRDELNEVLEQHPGKSMNTNTKKE